MNPEIDKIASAALDNEASEAELAELLNDPGFSAAKAELGAASTLVSEAGMPQAPAGLAQSQIANAMEAFKADAAVKAVKAAEPVSTNAPAPQKSGFGMPGWLVPAFFSVVVVAGIGFVALNGLGNTSAVSNESAAVAGRTETTTAATEESGESMEEMDSMDDGAADVAPATTTTNADLSSDAESELAEESAGSSVEDPFTIDGYNTEPMTPAEPIQQLPSPLVADKSLDAERVKSLVAETWADAEPPTDYLRCGPEQGFNPPSEVLLQAFPFTYGQEPAELLVYELEDGDQVTLIVDDACVVLGIS